MEQVNIYFFIKKDNSVSAYDFFPLKFKTINNSLQNQYFDVKYFSDHHVLDLFECSEETKKVIEKNFLKTYLSHNESSKLNEMDEMGFSSINYERKTNKEILMSKLNNMSLEGEDDENLEIELQVIKEDELSKYQIFVNCNSKEEKDNLFNFQVKKVNFFRIEEISLVKLPTTFVHFEDNQIKQKINEIEQTRIKFIKSSVKKFSNPVFVESQNDLLIFIGINCKDVTHEINTYFNKISKQNDEFKKTNKITLISNCNSNEHYKTYEEVKKRPEAHYTRQSKKDNGFLKSKILMSDKSIVVKDETLYDLITMDSNDAESHINTTLQKDIYEQIKPKIEIFKKLYKLRFMIKPTKDNQINIQVTLPENLKQIVLESIEIQIHHISVDTKIIPMNDSNEYPNLNYFLSLCEFTSVSKFSFSENTVSLTLVGNSYNINKLLLLLDAHIIKTNKSNENKNLIETYLGELKF